jgi:FtsH-binding integral membrane protein
MPQQKTKTKKEKRGFYFKTMIDGLISGLIAIGIFLGRPANALESNIFGMLTGMILIIVVLIMIYAYQYNKEMYAFGIFFVVAVAIVEVMVIGWILGESTESIIVTIFIVSPSVIIFDKLLG